MGVKKQKGGRRLLRRVVLLFCFFSGRICRYKFKWRRTARPQKKRITIFNYHFFFFIFSKFGFLNKFRSINTHIRMWTGQSNEARLSNHLIGSFEVFVFLFQIQDGCTHKTSLMTHLTSCWISRYFHLYKWSLNTRKSERLNKNIGQTVLENE